MHLKAVINLIVCFCYCINLCLFLVCLFCFFIIVNLFKGCVIECAMTGLFEVTAVTTKNKRLQARLVVLQEIQCFAVHHELTHRFSQGAVWQSQGKGQGTEGGVAGDLSGGSDWSPPLREGSHLLFSHTSLPVQEQRAPPVCLALASLLSWSRCKPTHSRRLVCGHFTGSKGSSLLLRLVTLLSWVAETGTVNPNPSPGVRWCGHQCGTSGGSCLKCPFYNHRKAEWTPLPQRT